MVRRHTLAVLQAAFSTVLASCAAPPPVTPTEPTPPAPVASAPPAAPPPVTAEVPAPPATLPAASTAPPSTATAEDAARFVDGASNARGEGQRCLGSIVPSLRPGKPVDSLEMRFLDLRSKEKSVVITGRAGSPCGTAKDRDACQRAYEGAVPREQGEVYVYTRGDEVGLLTQAQVPAFLAPIDSPEEAAAVLAFAPPDDRADGSCEPASITATKAGFTSVQERWSRCDRDLTTYTIGKDGKTRRAGTRHIAGKRPCALPVPGRRPEGLVGDDEDLRAAGSTMGAYLAEACTLEAASVTSFRRLERELGALGAPLALRRRASRSAREEAAHARIVRRLARRAGVEPAQPRVARITGRSPVAIAIENAVEGCVHETWAALVARFQAEHATDSEVRAAMQTIARDEARHAALAWDVHAWLVGLLSPEDHARVREAYEAALAGLVDASADALGENDRAALGLPSVEGARTLARAWRHAATRGSQLAV